MKYQGHHNKNYWKKCCGRCKLPKAQCCHGVVCANNNSTEHDHSDVSSTEYVDTAHPSSNLSHNNCTKELTVVTVLQICILSPGEEKWQSTQLLAQRVQPVSGRARFEPTIIIIEILCRNNILFAILFESPPWGLKLLLNNKPINSYTSIYFLTFKADLFDIIFSRLLLLCLKCFVCLSEEFLSHV